MWSTLPLLFLTSLQIINGQRDYVQKTSDVNQLLYSSTLQWTTIQKGQKLPENSVMGAISAETEDNSAEAQGKAFICRIKNEGMWLLGQVRTTGVDIGNCVATMHGSVYRKENFEILENVEDGGRLTWARWDKFSKVPAGTIAGDSNSYVARRASTSKDGYSYQLGNMDPEGLGKITVITDDGAQDFEDGEVLVETEPIYYQMKKVKFNRWKKRVKVEPQVLGTATLTNTDEASEGIGRVDSVIGYE